MKVYNDPQHIGTVKYAVSFHNGISTHKDGSPCYGMRTFKSKRKCDAFIKSLIDEGYKKS